MTDEDFNKMSHKDLVLFAKDSQTLMMASVREIRNLREDVRHLEPKAAAYDLIQKISRDIPGETRGYAPDVTFQIEQLLVPKEETAVAVFDQNQENN